MEAPSYRESKRSRSIDGCGPVSSRGESRLSWTRPTRGNRPYRMATRHPVRYRSLLLRLREARQAMGMSQEGAAAAIGARQKYISKIETGERRIDPVELQELAELYGKPIGYFLE